MNSRVEFAAAVAALAGLALFLLAAAANPHAALRGWLAATVAWVAVSLGCLTIALMRVLVGTGVTTGFGPALRAASGTLPLMGLAFVPVLLGMGILYPWVTVAPDNPFQKLWLQPGFFAARTILYFLLWAGLAVLALRGGRRPLATAGLMIIGPTGSLAAVDWMVSLEPQFHSSIYGMLFITHAALVGWSFAAAMTLLAGRPAAPRVAAGYIIGGILLWAYLSFCQYLVVWNGNEAHEIHWYLRREDHVWGAAFWSASLLEGIVPFLFLMPARLRASRSAVAILALVVVAGGLLEIAVFVLPAFRGDLASALAWPPAMVGLGGAWLLVFSRRFRKLPAGEVSHG